MRITILDFEMLMKEFVATPRNRYADRVHFGMVRRGQQVFDMMVFLKNNESVGCLLRSDDSAYLYVRRGEHVMEEVIAFLEHSKWAQFWQTKHLKIVSDAGVTEDWRMWFYLWSKRSGISNEFVECV